MNLKIQHFYFGAILNALIEYNPDAKQIVLLEKSPECRNYYSIETNQQKCIVFFKYASESKQSKNNFHFNFNDMEKKKLIETKEINILIYLLCKKDDLKTSEIIVLKINELIQSLDNKNSIIIKLQKNSPYVDIPIKRQKTTLKIERNRITQSFNKLLNK